MQEETPADSQASAPPDIRYRLILDSALDAIVTINSAGRVVDWNRQAEILFGWTQAEAVGRSMHEMIIPPQHREAHRRGMERYLATGEGPILNRRLEITALRRDGGEFPVELTVAPGRMEGRPLFTAFIRDLTEQKTAENRHRKSEEDLRRREEQLHLIIDAVPALISYVDSDLHYRFNNRAYEEWFGMPRAQIEGRHMREVLGEAAFAKILPRIQAALAGETKVYEDELPYRSAGTRFVRGHYIPHRRPDGAVVGFVVLILDFTERFHLEEALRQSQKMEAVGRLAGGIAHDFNNLLTVVNGYSELALAAAGDGELRGLLEEIRQSGQRAAALTGQLLAFSRKQVLAPKVIDLNATVRNLDSLLQRVIGEDVSLETRLHQGLWPARVDPGQMEQVILNLVLNARDAMPRGGALTLVTDNAVLEPGKAEDWPAPPPGRYVALCVRDTGTGMTQEVMARVFEPFFTTKEPGKGTGLGLATVYGIVQQSGGGVRVRSEPGKGSEFHVYLPALPGESVETRPAPAAEKGGGETILVVEDEAAVRRFIRLALQRKGYTVLEAGGGREALELARGERHIHLLLTDVVMPGMGGLELARGFSQIHPESRILYMSGYSDAAGGRMERQWLEKPFNAEKLVARVREALDA